METFLGFSLGILIMTGKAWLIIIIWLLVLVSIMAWIIFFIGGAEYIFEKIKKKFKK